MRLVPVTDDPDTGAFFAAAREHRLVVRVCSTCGRALHLPRAFCYHCQSWDTQWCEVAGTGSLYAWTVVERSVDPGYPSPYTVVLVDLDDAIGVRLVGDIPGRPELRVGQRMRVWFQSLGEDVVLPNWRVG